ncbi:hypothetical protein FKG94_23400 [Exilibacterium tricleocarpae]|uniref:LPS-assembly lipoprotein LptE n=1 Tax=Exilibacterium tricleocarpae TaxID=2591008 RepID=A0A545STF2_9GAMM|nr:LPS assembly lipoprotein LptE [Exilibacterium tricleocarpae]TQV68247.1 hypothetical protein FKG94_23400 [Exilibacterium tricleocarpae]
MQAFKPIMTTLLKPLFVLLLSAALASGCGWRLRGSLALPSDLTAVHLSTRDTHGNLATDMRRLLQSNDIDIVSRAADSQYSISIEAERDRRRTVSVGSDALAAEYELSMEADYRILRSDGSDAVTPATARVVRSFNFDVDDVTGGAEEERVIRTEMRRELAQQIIRRLLFAAQSTPAADSTAPQDAPSQRPAG